MRTHLIHLTTALLAAAFLGHPALGATISDSDHQDAIFRAKTARATLDRNQPAVPAGTLLIEPTRCVEARLGFAAEVPELTPTGWVVFAAVPPNLPTQHVTLFNINPKTMEIPDTRIPSRKLFVTVLSAGEGSDAHKLKIGAVYRLQLFKRTFIPAVFKSQPPADLPSLDSPEITQSLLPTETLDFDAPAFQTALVRNDLRPHYDESELDFARRAFTTLKSQLHYDYKLDMDRHSSFVWQAAKSDCGGINGLFVSVLRANGIPARNLCGRWAQSAKDGDTLGGIQYAQWHVKAEFFLRDVGWIPADLSGAVECSPANDSGLAFFAQDHGDFITMHTDFDLQVDALQFGKQNLIADQGFAYWVAGAGSMTGQINHEFWQVREIPAVVTAK